MQTHFCQRVPFGHTEKQNPDDVIMLVWKKSFKSWYRTL
jgi:hypothetical protein